GRRLSTFFRGTSAADKSSAMAWSVPIASPTSTRPSRSSTSHRDERSGQMAIRQGDGPHCRLGDYEVAALYRSGEDRPRMPLRGHAPPGGAGRRVQPKDQARSSLPPRLMPSRGGGDVHGEYTTCLPNPQNPGTNR